MYAIAITWAFFKRRSSVCYKDENGSSESVLGCGYGMLEGGRPKSSGSPRWMALDQLAERTRDLKATMDGVDAKLGLVLNLLVALHDHRPLRQLPRQSPRSRGI